MSDISPISQPAAPILGHKPKTAHEPVQTETAKRGNDRVELSATAQLLSKIADLPDIRQDLVDRVRASLEDGTYETDARTDAAIDGLLDDIA